jgi:hypothetical protein
VSSSFSILDKKIMARLGVRFFFSVLPNLTQNCKNIEEKKEFKIILVCLKNIKYNNKKYIFKKTKKKKKIGVVLGWPEVFEGG